MTSESQELEKIVYPGGTIKYKYRFNDRLHRKNGSALIWPDGSMEWYINGKRHREDGPAAISLSTVSYCIDYLLYSEKDYIEYLLEHYPKEVSLKNLLDLKDL